MLRFLSFAFIAAISYQSTHAQVYVRTETVDGFPVQIYSATVSVKIKGKKNAGLDKAYTDRQDIYKKMKDQVSELARSRTISLTTIESSEVNQSSFKQNYNETIHSSSAAYVEIKPIRETIEKKHLKTEIELWVSPIPSLANSLDAFPETLSPSELFDHIHIKDGQKYLVSLKKDVVFDEGDFVALFNKTVFTDTQTSQAVLPEDLDTSFLYRTTSRDLMTFTAGSFVSEMLIVRTQGYREMNASVFLIFKRDNELFSIRLFTVDNSEIPTLSELISRIQNHRVGSPGFDDYFLISPVYDSFKSRIVN